MIPNNYLESYTINQRIEFKNKPERFIITKLIEAYDFYLDIHCGALNDAFTRLSIQRYFIDLMENFRLNRISIFSYQIICDERNNNPSVINRGDLVVDIGWFDSVETRIHNIKLSRGMRR